MSLDRTYDVIVVGYGAAGANAAIAAHDNGARVLIFEKMDHLGGCSVLAGGFVKAADDREKANTYLKKTQGGRVDDSLISVFAQGMKDIPEQIRKLALTDGAEICDRVNTGGTLRGEYPFEGAETFFSVFVKDIPGFTHYEWANKEGNLGGQRLMKLLEDNVVARNIPVVYKASVKELLTGENGDVIGVSVDVGGKRENYFANKGVILASGGFEFNEKLKKDYIEATPVYSMGNPGNTGDGILMSQKVGAALWHMWLLHGSYGFKFPEIDTAIRTVLGGARNDERKVPWILIDHVKGRRFMNEYHPAPQDTMNRPLGFFDPDIVDYPRIPAILIFDENGRKLGSIGFPLYASEEFHYEWSRDNSKEIEKGWIKKYDTLEELAEDWNIPAVEVEKTVAEWNESVRNGEDRDFARPSGTLFPIDTAPFYAVPVWPICTNTQGGPVHNEKQQVLDPYDKPIPGLYSAGELGAFWGHLYLLGGNLSECFVSGKIAGEEAAKRQ